MSTNVTKSVSVESDNAYCPLCKSDNVHFFDKHPFVDQQRWRCKNVDFILIFLMSHMFIVNMPK
jgi:transposase-like protein